MAAETREPRIESRNAMTIAGLQRRFDFKDMDDIPKLWMELGPYFGKVPAAVSAAAYGVISGYRKGVDAIDYLAGFEVRGTDLPKAFVRFEIPPLTYAVFEHKEHVSKIRDTIMSAIDVWLPASGRKRLKPMTGGLQYFERYDEDYDPQVAIGHIAIWIPIEP